MLHVVHNFKEGHSLTRDGFTGLDHGGLDVSSRALAASVVKRSRLGWLDISTGWLLAHEFALRARAESRLLALPVALSLLAHWGAESIRGGTSGTALSWSADSLALRAIGRLA